MRPLRALPAFLLGCAAPEPATPPQAPDCTPGERAAVMRAFDEELELESAGPVLRSRDGYHAQLEGASLRYRPRRVAVPPDPRWTERALRCHVTGLLDAANISPTQRRSVQITVETSPSAFDVRITSTRPRVPAALLAAAHRAELDALGPPARSPRTVSAR